MRRKAIEDAEAVRRKAIEDAEARFEAFVSGLAEHERLAEERARRWPPAERAITEGMYDRLRANPSATKIIVTRLEWQLLSHANGIIMTPAEELKATLFGLPVVIIEDEEMSW